MTQPQKTFQYPTPDEPTAVEDHTIVSFDAIPARPGKLCEGCDMRHYCDAKNWRFCGQ